MLDIILLSRSIDLTCLSDSRIAPFLFRFVFEQSGVSGGLTLRSLSKAAVSLCVLFTSSRYCDLAVGSVSPFRLALSARNKPPSSTASDVSAAALAIVPVGTSTHMNDTGVVGVGSSVHEPIALKELFEAPVDEDPVAVGRGKMPITGIELDDADADADTEIEADDDPLPIELELLNPFTELEIDLLPVPERELVKPVWLDLDVCDLVVNPLEPELSDDVALDKKERDNELLVELENHPLVEFKDDWLLKLDETTLE